MLGNIFTREIIMEVVCTVHYSHRPKAHYKI